MQCKISRLQKHCFVDRVHSSINTQATSVDEWTETSSNSIFGASHQKKKNTMERNLDLRVHFILSPRPVSFY